MRSSHPKVTQHIWKLENFFLGFSFLYNLPNIFLLFKSFPMLKKFRWFFLGFTQSTYPKYQNQKQFFSKIIRKIFTCFKFFWYSKHWPYTVAHTIDCLCSKMLNHGLNHGLFLSLFTLILYVYSAYTYLKLYMC